MKNSEFLYELVHSMSKVDKDNFMRLARVRGKRSDLKYLQLYRAIEGQKTYNEAALKDSFDFANFSEAKAQLSQLILRSLSLYDSHPETLMQNRLSEIRILLDRSLYDFAMKKIEQAREIARQEERFEALRALDDLEIVALPFVETPKTLQARREEIVEQRHLTFRQTETLQELKDLHDRDLNAVLAKSSRSGLFGAEAVAELERHPMLSLPDESLPMRAQVIKHRIWNVIRMQQLDFAKRAEVLKQTLRLFDEHPFLIEEEPVRYVFSLGAYGSCLNAIGQYQDSLDATLRLLLVRASHDNVVRSIFLNFATNLCTYTLLRGDVGPLRDHMSYLLAGMRTHAENTPAATLVHIRYLFAIVFWMAGDLRRAQRYAKEVVEDPAGRLNYQAACKTFLLIFAYEQEDPDTITSLLRAWRRQWKKKPPAYEIERIFGDHIGRLIDQAGREQIHAELGSCLEHIQAYLSGGMKVRADNFVFVVHWLEAKLSGKGLVEVVGRKLQQA
ncbi:MAG: hypothetical protein U0176_21865 [Bacteroidia bacterium]